MLFGRAPQNDPNQIEKKLKVVVELLLWTTVSKNAVIDIIDSTTISIDHGFGFL